MHHIVQVRNIFILKELFGPFGSVAVGCFFFISGYGLYASYSINKSYLDGFLLKRFRKLIVPFIFVILLYQLISLESYKGIFSGLIVGNLDYILPYSWYIFCAILFYFAFYCIFISALVVILYLTDIKYIGIIEICFSSLGIMLSFTILNISSKCLVFLGSISYEIYLVQGIIFYLLGKKVLIIIFILLYCLLYL